MVDVLGIAGGTYREEGAEHADHDGEEDDQEQAESGAFAAGRLGVDDGEGEGSVAVYDGCEVIDAVHDGDGIEERCYDSFSMTGLLVSWRKHYSVCQG